MLILASQSPRRAELLRNAGRSLLRFVPTVWTKTNAFAGEATRREYVTRLARGQSAGRLEKLTPPVTLMLGADTTVVIDGESLGKPVDEAEARRMLERLSGRDATR